MSELSREEAVKIADQLVAEWMGEVKNSRGYVHDKWTPTPVEERATAVLRIADFLSPTVISTSSLPASRLVPPAEPPTPPS